MYLKTYLEKIVKLVRLGIKTSLILSISILSMYTSCLAGQGEMVLVNPVWKGILKQTGQEVRARGTFQACEETVSSYDEFRLVLIRAMRSRQSDVTIYFDPHRRVIEGKEWNYHFWGPPSSSEPTDSDLFQEIPWLYWAWTGINWHWSYEWSNNQWFVTKMTYNISYSYGPDKENALEKGLVKTLDQIVSPDMDMFTREKSIHDWIVNHVDYDEATLNGSDDLGYTDYSAFTRGLAVCEGYSVLAYRMLSMAGIPSLTVDGNATTTGISRGPHAWDMVNLCGNWYHLDVTWDDLGLYGDHTVYYHYFNLPDWQMEQDHIWDMDSYPPANRIFNKSACQGEIEHRCSIFEPGLCDTELECIRISGNWCGTYCEIGSCPVVVSPSKLNMDVGATRTATVTGGTAPYTVTSSDANVCTVAVSGNTVTVIGVAAGTCTVTVDDSASPALTATIAVTVTADVTPRPVPTTQNMTELSGSDIANAPVDLGSVVTNGDQMQLAVNFPAYAAAVDEYVAIQIPDGSLFFLAPDGSLTDTNMVAYAKGVTAAQKVTAYKPFDICTPFGPAIPTGTWTVYSLVSPTNDGDLTNVVNYDLPYYTFTVTCP